MNFKRIILAKAFSPSSVNLTRKVNRHQLFGYLLSFQILFVVAIVVVVIKLAPRFFSPFPSRRGYKITQNDAEKPHFHKYWCHHLVTPPLPPVPNSILESQVLQSFSLLPRVLFLALARTVNVSRTYNIESFLVASGL